MSEIGFHIKEAGELSDDEFNALRRHYLVYAWAERDEHRNLHRDLDAIYTEIDRLVARGELLPIVNSLNTCGRIVIFSRTSPSTWCPRALPAPRCLTPSPPTTCSLL